MGIQVIAQPDGRYAIFDRETDTFTARDLTAVGVRAVFVQDASARADAAARKILAALAAGEKPYYQFTLTYAQAAELERQSHARTADETPQELPAAEAP